MADKHGKNSHQDDFRYLSVPRPARGYHSDNESRQKKKTTPRSSSPDIRFGPRKGTETSHAVASGNDRPFPEALSPQQKRPLHQKKVSFGAVTIEALASQPRSTSPGDLSDKTYYYRQLGKDEFRLVRVLPTRTSTIKLEILHRSITSPPDYVAVSYTWGDPGDTRRLELDGTEIRVSSSLHGALRALRQHRDAILVWVDALSIDQQNSAEKTQQIQLMTRIYRLAKSVAIWLGPEADESDSATRFLKEVARKPNARDFTPLISSGTRKAEVRAVISLFEREYWNRLWVVQEVFNARKILVYCGSSVLPWETYTDAASVFRNNMKVLNRYLSGTKQGKTYTGVSRNHFTYAAILANHGPSSLPKSRSLTGFIFGEYSLLEVMRACRTKNATDPKDKVFGTLGLLSEELRNDIRVDYRSTLKSIYTHIVDLIVSTTGRLDVICDSIHYPLHANNASLPSWVPDWSHNPGTKAMGAMNLTSKFSASLSQKAKIVLDGNLLELSGVEIDTIEVHGIAVGPLGKLADYLMAFVHWRALFLGQYRGEKLDNQYHFFRALCLNQVPSTVNNPKDWVTACNHVFASLLRERLPELPLDRELEEYVHATTTIGPQDRRQFLQEHFGDRMRGRCFYVTKEGRLGMGSGYMAVGDAIVVPFGCSTPIIIRPEGSDGGYRYVGDTYLNGFMYGRAINQWRKGERKERKFKLR
ncbi:hypothetical protein CSAL01_01801 [Colletotrichum salicis]|uniref:Heterokaryon incompatibility domain-containing protein n=1 Tax=Colletotrichum salicis TaxID=1209931 RepID=A0A135T6X9_9PEZI|nr:hypothetical protein CSAL01_01801 [Colletotrichum salicis]